MTGEVDVLERVARFAPTPSSTVQEWSAGEELNLLSRRPRIPGRHPLTASTGRWVEIRDG